MSIPDLGGQLSSTRYASQPGVSGFARENSSIFMAAKCNDSLLVHSLICESNRSFAAQSDGCFRQRVPSGAARWQREYTALYCSPSWKFGDYRSCQPGCDFPNGHVGCCGVPDSPRSKRQRGDVCPQSHFD